jgi:hypothetical protein
MKLERAGQTRARMTGSKNPMSGFDGTSPREAERDFAELGCRPSNDASALRSITAPEASALAIEIFGMAAGVLVPSGSRFVFRATHRAFWDLHEQCFNSAAHAERAAQLSWTRFQHRSPPGMRAGGRRR